MARQTSFLVTLVLCTAPLSAQTAWLPEDTRVAAAQSFADQLKAIDFEPHLSDPARAVGARKGIDKLATVIDQWGVDGVLERTPVFPQIPLPATSNPLVASLTSFGVCSLPLHLELATTQGEKIYVITAEFSVGLLSAFLRHQFLEAGGTDEALRDFLTSGSMNSVSLDIQASEELRAYVNEQCAPTLTALMR